MAHSRKKAPESHAIPIGVRGRIVLPAGVRRRLGLRQGDRMVLTVEPDASLRLRSLRQHWRNLRGLYRDLAPGRSLAGELIRERREEARREDRR